MRATTGHARQPLAMRLAVTLLACLTLSVSLASVARPVVDALPGVISGDTPVDWTRLRAATDRLSSVPGIEAVIVVHGGEIIEERYWGEGGADRPHNIKSASKSVMSALIGIAVGKGVLDIEQPIVELLPKAAELASGAKRDITVEHLLSMTSGYEPTSYQAYNPWVQSSDWVRELLRKPLVAEPGTRYQYSTGNTHLLSAILAARSGLSTRTFAERNLFQPMGIDVQGWTTDPQGLHMGGNNLSLLPRDIAKFGQLYLDRGRWGNQQLVPTDWITRSLRPSSQTLHAAYGRYGLLWWLPTENVFAAVGYGGQFVVISPLHDAVVVVLATQESKGDAWEERTFGLLLDEVLGSLAPSPFAPSRVAPLLANSPAGSASTTDRVNLRTAPSLHGLRIGVVEAQRGVSVYGREGPWLLARVDDRVGWLHSDFTDVAVEASAGPRARRGAGDDPGNDPGNDDIPQLASAPDTSRAPAATRDASSTARELSALRAEHARLTEEYATAQVDRSRLQHRLDAADRAQSDADDELEVLRGLVRDMGDAVGLAPDDLPPAPTHRTVARVNFRRAPGMSGERHAVLEAGTAFTLLGQDGSWLRARVDDTEGWIQASYTEPLPGNDAGSAGQKVDTLRRMSRGLSASLQAVKAADVAHRQADQALSASRVHIDDLERTLEQARREEQERAAREDARRTEVARLQAELASRESLLNDSASDLDAARLRISEDARTIAALRHAHEGHNDELLKIEADGVKATADAQTAHARAEALAAELARLRSEVAQARSRFEGTRGELEAKLQAAQQHAGAMTDAADRARDEERASSRLLAATRAELQATRQEAASLAASEAALRADVDAARGESARLQQALDVAHASTADKARENDVLRADGAAAQRAIDDAQGRLQALQGTLAELDSRNQHDSELLASEQRESASLRKSLGEALQQIAELETQREQSSEQALALRSSKEALEEREESLQRQADALAAELEESTARERETRTLLSTVEAVLAERSEGTAMQPRVRTTAPVNFRDGPGLEAKRITVLPADTTLLALGQSGEWIQARFRNVEGWLHASYVRPLESAAAQDDASQETLAVGDGDLPQSAAELGRAVADLALRLDASEAQREALESELAQAGTDRDRQQSMLQAVRGESARLRQQLAASEASSTTLEDRLSKLEAGRDEQQGALHAVREESALLRQRLAAAEEQNAALNGQLAALDAERDSQRTALQEAGDDMESLRQRLAASEASRTAAEAARAASEERSRRESETARTARERLAWAEPRLADALETTSSLSSEVEALRAQKVEQTAQLLALRQSNEDAAAREVELEAMAARGHEAITLLAGVEAALDTGRSSAPTSVAGRRYRTSTPVNLRSAPGLDATRIQVVPAHTDLLAIARSEDWLQVTVGDMQGWVHTRYARPAEEPAARVPALPETVPERVASLTRSARALEETVAALRQGLAAAETQTAALRRTVSEMRAERREEQAARDTAHGELESFRLRLAAAQARAATLETSLSEVRAARDAKQAALDAAQKANTTLRRQQTGTEARAVVATADEADLATQPSRGSVPGTGTPDVRQDVFADRRMQEGGEKTAESSHERLVRDTVEAWALAWMRQDVPSYLTHYSPDFRPTGGLSRSAWEAQRRRRIERPKFIEIAISEMEVSVPAADRASAVFTQRYRADHYRDETRKTLEMVRDKDRWLIAGEKSTLR